MLKIVGIIMVVAVAALAGGAYKLGFIMNDSPTEPVAAKSVYEFTMRDIDGKNVKLDAYKGKVVMIVNTASKCGYTPQYEGLQALYDKNKDKGFVVIGFQAKNFMGREPAPITTNTLRNSIPSYRRSSASPDSPAVHPDSGWLISQLPRRMEYQPGPLLQ